ncbi:TauD/TfdA family dioxygenase [Alphaproteobacteria bacterium]|nr:TauD/TfdA family dioxygenase [Alphaproteobacteria bacterium]
MTHSGASVHALKDGFVGEITGLDLSLEIDVKVAAFLTKPHQNYPVLAIRDQSLGAEALMAYGAVFGGFDIDHHVSQYQDKEHPEVVYLTNRDTKGAPDPASADRRIAWHVDSTFTKAPCAHMALRAMEIPSKGGGTHFANMVQAYVTLPKNLKAAIEGRRARHKFGASPVDGDIFQ